MDQISVTHFPTPATLHRIRTLRENLIDLSVALDDTRAELRPRLDALLCNEQDADPVANFPQGGNAKARDGDPEIIQLAAQQDRLAALLDATRRELAALLGRAA